MKRYEVSGFPSLDVVVEAESPEAAEEAWKAVLHRAALDLGLVNQDGIGRWQVEDGFFSEPVADGAMTGKLHVELAYDPDAPENQPATEKRTSRTIGGLLVTGVEKDGDEAWTGYVHIGDGMSLRTRWSTTDGSVLLVDGGPAYGLRYDDEDNFLELDTSGLPVPACGVCGIDLRSEEADGAEDGVCGSCQADEVDPLPSAGGTDLETAVRAMLADFGGDVPDYLDAAVGAVENALANPAPVQVIVDMSGDVLCGVSATAPVELIVLDYDFRDVGEPDEEIVLTIPQTADISLEAVVLRPKNGVQVDRLWTGRVFASLAEQNEKRKA